MSSTQQANRTTGLSKSAAKKKKQGKRDPEPSSLPSISPQPVPTPAAAAQGNASQPPRSYPAQHNVPQSHPHAHPHPALPHPLPPNFDPSLFFSQGSFPTAEFTYESAEFYDETNPPPPGQPATTPFSLPFPFDYSAFGGNAQNGIAGGFNITHEDLIQTANELYRRMADPNFGSEDAYWSSLPPHLRQFIREAVPFSNNPPPNGQARGGPINEGQQGMWTMAQQIVNAASQGMGLGPGVGAGLLGVGVTANRQYPQPGLGEELGFRRHPDAKEEEFDEEDDFDLDEPGYIAPNGEAPKKKNKKKKKKGGAGAQQPVSALEPPPAALPPPAVKQPPRQPLPPNPPNQPTLNPPPPPTTPVPAHPPPSSRAAGKQPMTNAPATNQPPARSARAAGKAPASAAPPHNHSHHNHPPPSKPASTVAGKGKAPANTPPAKIWTQSSLQDRENIRQFWLGLSEAERRDLLQIEKDAVLRKMKEQHRHACGCAVCGRKKVNIESELDQLYEQYYDELRHYAAEQRAAATGRQHPPPGAGPFPGSVEVDSTGQVTKFDHRAPDPNHLAQDDIIDDASEEYDDEEYDDEEDLEDDDIGSDEADMGDDIDDPHPPQPQRQPRPQNKAPPARAAGADDFMTFGSSLATIKGGILTVADDLLKNDGAKFLEMMEQLAVARSVREEQNLRDLQDETEDDYDEKDDEPISEAERMEEGKRMFQIFAARMFEQRVLQAYREKVAKQREEQLLRELEAEDDAKRQKEEKKAKESQKKKDKKKMQKQKADEEKAARDAAAAAEVEAAKAKAEQAERDRQKRAEEERARREAVKKAAQEEQARQAADRKKRQQEEKEREEEAAKKKREREERARKEREAREKEAKEKERRDREERLAKEKADKAEKERLATEKAENDRLAKEARDKAEKERLAKLEEERQEKARKDEASRKEREAAEQAKILAAQQAQRERARAEKVASEKAATEKAAAAERSARPVQPMPVRAKVPSRNGTLGSPPSTESMSSPVKPIAPPGVGRPPVRPQQKTPQPYFPQPIPPGFTNRMPVAQTFGSGAPGFRPTFPSASTSAFSPPSASNSNGLPSLSPNPPSRGYAPEPSPPYDLGPRTAPIGMGFPPVSSKRMPSVDETFSPPTAPIGSLNSRNASGDLLDDYRHVSNPAPIAPPPGPIGRPSAYLEAPTASSSASRTSPSQPEQVFGSAALGGDDEIVQTPRRNMSNGWDIPTSAAPGAGRWSTAPTTSLWGNTPTTDASWAPPGRQPSFGGIGSSFAAPPPVGSVGSQPFGGIFGAPGTPGSNNNGIIASHAGHSIHSHPASHHQPQPQQQQHH